MDEDIKVVAFDVDGTLVRENFWGHLHALFALPEEDDRRWFRLYEEGKLGYRAWMDAVSEAYRKNPKPKAEIDAVLSEYLFAPGAKMVVERLRGKYELALVSSNIDSYVEDVGNRLTIPFRYAFSRFEYDDAGMFSKIGFYSEGSEGEAKVDAIKDLCARLLVKPAEVMFVGDSLNDLEAFRYTGHGVLLREGNEELRTAAWKRIATISELTDIIG